MSAMQLDAENWHVAVLIPARNEEELLPRCLGSVLAAGRCLPRGHTFDIVVVSDSSVDRTAAIAARMLQHCGAAVIETAVGNVGSARALAAKAAIARVIKDRRTDLARCWLANTDADCEVPENWLLDQLLLARRGFTAVAGIVDVDGFTEHLPIVESRFRRTYQIHEDGTHPHVHGANLGVRADAYLCAGGWNPLPTAEDHDLWARLRSGAGRHFSDAKLQVITSGRRIGRAPLGFAGALAKHNEPVAEPLLGAA